jgi:hypothetical protein
MKLRLTLKTTAQSPEVQQKVPISSHPTGCVVLLALSNFYATYLASRRTSRSTRGGREDASSRFAPLVIVEALGLAPNDIAEMCA